MDVEAIERKWMAPKAVGYRKWTRRPFRIDVEQTQDQVDDELTGCNLSRLLVGVKQLDESSERLCPRCRECSAASLMKKSIPILSV